GRGKAGGIQLASDAESVRTHALNILGMDIRGHVVETLWIERASDIAEEYYASFTLDRSAKLHLGLLSARGGVDIEQVAAQERDEREEAAHAKGLQYVGLDGYVGIIANGAGLAMSTVDIVSQVGGEPANFLDIGGGANADVMANALEVINNDAEVKSIFINI